MSGARRRGSRLAIPSPQRGTSGARLWVAVALGLACAGPQKPRPAPERPPPRLPPPSSILAVLGHREELALDGGQVAQLVEIQRELDRENAEASESAAAAAAKGAAPKGAGGDGRPARPHGAPGGSRRDKRAEPANAEEALYEAVSENDTRAFLRAEPIFSKAKGQWDRAREIAESYRADYADRWEKARRPGSGSAR